MTEPLKIEFYIPDEDDTLYEADFDYLLNLSVVPRIGETITMDIEIEDKERMNLNLEEDFYYRVINVNHWPDGTVAIILKRITEKELYQ